MSQGFGARFQVGTVIAPNESSGMTMSAKEAENASKKESQVIL